MIVSEDKTGDVVSPKITPNFLTVSPSRSVQFTSIWAAYLCYSILKMPFKSLATRDSHYSIADQGTAGSSDAYRLVGLFLSSKRL